MQRSKLGGIFSPVEGGNRATSAFGWLRVSSVLLPSTNAAYMHPSLPGLAAEYLLAGLPVVSTPSFGGRDVYFHASNSIIVEPTRQAGKAGVEAGLDMLRRGLFNRTAIRNEALLRNAMFRDAFLRDISRVLVERGIPASEATSEGIFSRGWTPGMAPPLIGTRVDSDCM